MALTASGGYSDIIRKMDETGNMRGQVERALDKVRPALQADGGDARVVECDEASGKVSIEMLGACGGCPLSQLDFVYAIESLIRREVPEVQDIVSV
ncbi:MAG TPA: NifU family protein [Rubrobacteraceae bacterium]